MRTCSLFTLLLAVCSSLFAQNNYYPGGIGNGNLKIWLNAANNASLTYNGSNQVAQWSDLSGNAYHFTQATALNKPVYNATGGPNSLPALMFTRANTQFLGNSLLPSSISFASGVSSFAIVNFTSTGTYERIFDFGNAAASDNILTGRQASSQSFFYEGWNGASGGQTATTSTPIVNGTPNMYEAIQQGGTPGTNTAVSFYSAGTAQPAIGALGTVITPLANSVNRTANFVGKSNWGPDAFFEGAMSEILFYNTALNTTQRTLVESYLSAAWGMSVSPTYFTPPAAGTFNKNLVGIGYTSVSDNVLSNPAGATDGLGFSSGTTGSDFLNVAGFLMAAHNGQANSLLNGINITGISTQNINRLNRSWYVHRSNGNASGNVTVQFSFNDYNGSSLPAGAVSYGLLFNATSNNFSGGTNVLKTNSSSTAGSSVNFVVPASSLADGYYSLVWSTTTLLPVQLLRFSAVQSAGKVQLQWQSANAVNFSHFVLQRSTDGVSFQNLSRIELNQQGVYHFTDEQPSGGWNYYRLQLYDLDGNSRFSGIKSVKMGLTGLLIFPNPVSHILHLYAGISANTPGKFVLEIVNGRGQTVWKGERARSTNIDIPVDFLLKGQYFLRVRDGQETKSYGFSKL